jgi:hypothetical protein
VDAAVPTKSGRIDLLALSESGQPVRLENKGTKDYRWLLIRPRAIPRAQVEDRDRVSAFGLGGEIEARSGVIVQKQIIDAPVVHFGLGDHKTAGVLRFVWPHGAVQYEFDKHGDEIIVVLQRLKTSCPFLFTDDGHGMQFVTDFMWSTPLGMYINGQAKGSFTQTKEWVKIRGDQLVPRDGFYDVRITANLWEAHYYDYMTLMVVDHPADTEILADERFFLAPTEPRIYVTGPSQPVAHAWDEKGRDVTDLVRAIDGKYLDTFERGRYQGIARDHYVEVDLGEDAPTDGPLYLIANGWLHPTNSSINAAIEQGTHEKPFPLVLEIPDGTGGWKVGRDDLGFLAGKNKTMVLRLDGIDGKGVARRFRLRTNMEIFWDALRYARGLDDSLARMKKLQPDEADLRYRGILEITQANASSPEIPHYDRVIHRGQYWRDQIGYYTRFGDVRELLAVTDDRYVIMNAGDEIAMKFRAPDDPPPGWKRDFIWISDGWTKDGDFNTRFSKTVLPLPYHDMTSYDQPPGRLQDDPVYKRFPEDWKNYHTRYVTPDVFEMGLRSFRRPRP